MEKSFDHLKKGEEEGMEKAEEDGRSTDECLRAYQISLTYSNTPGR